MLYICTCVQNGKNEYCNCSNHATGHFHVQNVSYQNQVKEIPYQNRSKEEDENKTYLDQDRR